VSWIPGRPVVTAADNAEWQEWRRRRTREQQRARRATLTRIDYYPSEEARALIDARRHRGPGGDASSIINGMIQDWSEPGLEDGAS
jgi:hypothetical protein